MGWQIMQLLNFSALSLVVSSKIVLRSFILQPTANNNMEMMVSGVTETLTVSRNSVRLGSYHCHSK